MIRAAAAQPHNKCAAMELEANKGYSWIIIMCAHLLIFVHIIGSLELITSASNSSASDSISSTYSSCQVLLTSHSLQFLTCPPVVLSVFPVPTHHLTNLLPTHQLSTSHQPQYYILPTEHSHFCQTACCVLSQLLSLFRPACLTPFSFISLSACIPGNDYIF